MLTPCCALGVTGTTVNRLTLPELIENLDRNPAIRIWSVVDASFPIRVLRNRSQRLRSFWQQASLRVRME